MPTDDHSHTVAIGSLPVNVDLPSASDNPELLALEQYHARFEAVASHMMGKPVDSAEYRTAEAVMLCLVDGFLEAFPPDDDPLEFGSLEWEGEP